MTTNTDTVATPVVTVNAGSSSLHPHVVLAEFCRDVAERFGVGAVGHRLVHGGPAVQRPTVADAATLGAAGQAATLAPVHVPVREPQLLGLAPGIDDGAVSAEGVPVLVVRPREELHIALDAMAAVG